MAQKCLGVLQVCAMRLSREDEAGYLVAGADNLAVIEPISLAIALDVETGTDYRQKNGCGKVCIRMKQDDEIVGANLTLVMCKWDPEVEEMLTGGRLITSGADNIGYFERATDLDAPPGVGMELWARVRDGDQDDINFRYLRFGIPKAYGWRRQDFTFGDNVITPGFVGMAEPNPLFANGPANDWPEDFEDHELYGWYWDNNPPAAVCGTTTMAAQSGS